MPSAPLSDLLVSNTDTSLLTLKRQDGRIKPYWIRWRSRYPDDAVTAVFAGF
jgi:hypothetical protein